MIASFSEIHKDRDRDKKIELDAIVAKSLPDFASVNKQIFTYIYENIFLSIDSMSGHLDIMGEMYSENSTMLERYWLNSDGTLSGEMQLHDPENFSRPPLQRTRWARANPDAVPAVGECDVDSFFRQIYRDGLMQEYINRSDRRF